MGILQAKRVAVGEVSELPGTVKIVTTDSLATITTAGYLNNQPLLGINLSPADLIQVIYLFNIQTQSGTFEFFTISITNGVITLVPFVSTGNVLLPVVNNDFAAFNGTTGQIKDSGAAPSTVGSPFVVMSPGALTVGNFPQIGNANGTITTGLPPSAAANAFVVVSPGGLTSGQIPQFNDVNGTLANSGILASNVMRLNTVNTMSGVGSIILPKVNGVEAANAVTASGVAGLITTSALTTAGGAAYAITWTNTVLTATSAVFLSLEGGTNTTKNITLEVVRGAGTATLTIYNNTAATALNGTILIGYLVI